MKIGDVGGMRMRRLLIVLVLSVAETHALARDEVFSGYAVAGRPVTEWVELSAGGSSDRQAADDVLASLTWADANAVSALYGCMSNRMLDRTVIAARTLAGMGSNGVALLMYGTRDGDARVRRASLDAIGGVHTNLADVIPLATRLLQDPDVQVSGKAQQLLMGAKWEHPAAVATAVTPLLEHPDRWVQVRAVTVLESVGPAGRPALDVLQAMTFAPPYHQNLFGAIERVGGAESVPYFVNMMGSTNLDLARAASQALRRLDDRHRDALRPYLPAFKAALQRPDVELQRKVVDLVYALEPKAPELYPAVVNVLRNSKDDDDRWSMTSTLVRIGTPADKAVPELIRALKDPDWSVRQGAAESLRAYGKDAAPALPALHALLRKQKLPEINFGAAPQQGPATHQAVRETITRIEEATAREKIAD